MIFLNSEDNTQRWKDVEKIKSYLKYKLKKNFY